MAIPFGDHIDLLKNELRNAVLHLLGADPGSPTEGQHWWNNTSHKAKFFDGTANRTVITDDVPLNSILAPTGDLSLNSHKITSLAAPTSGTDAVNRDYADAVGSNRDQKDSVRAASTVAGGNVTLSGTQTQDGVALIAGDRFLAKNQTTASQNGIYVVAAGAWARSTDADSNAEVTTGLTTFVEEGTVNAGTTWALTTANPITLGTTSLTFTQTGTGSTYSAGTGLSLTGSTFALQTPVSIANGGTGAASAAAARTALGVPSFYAASIGDGASTTITVTHNLGTRDVIVQVYKNATTWDNYSVGMQHTDANNVAIIFAVAPATNAYRVVVMAVS